MITVTLNPAEARFLQNMLEQQVNDAKAEPSLYNNTLVKLCEPVQEAINKAREEVYG